MKRLLLATLMPLMVTALFVAVPTASAQQHSLTGTVLDQDGDPVADADVYVYQYGGGETKCYEDEDGGYCETEPGYEEYYEADVRTDSQGDFAVPVRNGWASIQIRKEGYAGHHEGIEVNGSMHLDIEMLQYPDKTARIVGQITGAGAELRYVSVSVESPEYGLYECSVRPDEPRPMMDDEGHTHESGSAEAQDGSMESAEAEPAPPPEDSDVVASESIAYPEPYPYRGCAIQVDEDGSFEGNVTPGYSVLRFYHDSWRDEGGREYYAQSRVVDLPADATTRIDVDLVPRPGPDAFLSGYVVDGSSGQAIPDVHVSFSNQDAYGWASARTDKDGSYRVALRSGYTQVHVWADGYFPWEGQVQIAAGADRSFDITLTPGETRYGGCCYAYAEGSDVRTLEADGGADDAEAVGAPTAGDGDQAGGQETSEGSGFEDLGGGLGPYDPASRPSDDDTSGVDEGAPGGGILLALAAIVGVLILRRR